MRNAQAPQRRRAGLGRSLCAVGLALLCAVALSGCKDSDVLTEKIVGDPGQYEVDYSLPPVSINDPSAPISDGYEHEDDAEEESNLDIEESDPLYDEDTPTSDAPVESNSQAPYASNSPATSGASQEGAGSGSSSGDSSGSGAEADGQGAAEAPSQGADDPDPEDEEDPGPEDEADPGKGPDANPDDPGDEDNKNVGPAEPGKGVVISDPENGGYDELPYANKIAAAGPYATMVQALGGKGSLAAANASWLGDVQAKGAFPGELDGVAAISEWGDGTGMNDATVQAIIDSGADTYIYSNTYGMLSTAQAATLSNAGVNVVAMPTVGVSDAQDSDIQLAVELIGELLEKSETGALDAKAMAAEWNRQHAQAMQDTLRAGEGRPATLILDGYSYNWWYQGHNGVGGNGGQISDSSSRFYTTYIDSWGDVPAGYNGFRATNRFRVWPSTEWAPDDPVGESVADFRADGVGLTPLASGKVDTHYQLYQYYLQYAGLVDTSVGFLSRNDHSDVHFALGGCWCLWGTPNSSAAETGSALFSLGDDAFPVLFVRDMNIAEKVRASAARIDRDALQVGLYNYGKDYQILVMPEGVAGNWADGTFESFLMAPWAYAGAQAALDGNADTSDCEPYIANFYTWFYRCEGNAPVSYNAVLTAVCGR